MLIVIHCVFFFLSVSDGISSDALKVSSVGTDPQVVKWSPGVFLLLIAPAWMLLIKFKRGVDIFLFFVFLF